ncbi:MAG: hypothetical protein J7L73_04440 [Anaerolineales bacterium]|nr:hypothetical protein [Anaerolineales bacterium]
MIRSFDWLDIPLLHRYRDKGIYLSSVILATRGSLFAPGVLLSFISPASGVFTSIYSNDQGSHPPLIGQIVHLEGEQFGRISFLAPADELDYFGTNELLRHLTLKAGEHNDFYILAEPEDRSSTFQVLRQAGFTTYTRQRIWKLSNHFTEQKKPFEWQYASDQTFFDKNTLYNNLVPGLVQQFEPLAKDNHDSYVQYQNDQLTGFVELIYGHRGIWVQPFIHPDVENIEKHLIGMIQSIPNRRDLPLYICVRTYQSWLEHALENLGAESSSLQAVMARRLAVRDRAMNTIALPKIEGQTETPISLTQAQRTPKAKAGNIGK